MPLNSLRSNLTLFFKDYAGQNRNYLIETALGVALFYYLLPHLSFGTAIAVCFFSAVFFILFFGSTSSVPRVLGEWAGIISLSALLFSAVLVRGAMEQQSFLGLARERVAGFQGVLSQDSSTLSSGTTLYKVDLIKVWDQEGTVASAQGELLLFEKEEKSLGWGAVVRVESALQPRSSGGAGFFTASRQNMKIVFLGWQNPFYRFRYWIKGAIFNRVSQAGEQEAALFSAMFLGNKEGVAPHMTDNFRKSGAYHLLALSGLHVGIITCLVLFLFKPLLGRRAALVFALLFLGGYVLFVGPKVSLLRAAIMFAYMAAALFLSRKPCLKSGLAAAFLILLFISPREAGSLSFKLSFLAVLGILLFSQRIYRFLKPYLPLVINLPFSAALSAQIATSVLLLQEFKVVYPIGLLSGLVLIPLAALFIWLGLGYLLFADLPLFAGFFRAMFVSVYKILEGLLRFFSLFPSLGVVLGWGIMACLPVVWLVRRILEQGSNPLTLKRRVYE